MSKSNFFGPGANEVENGTTTHPTSLFGKPSFPATAYATAPSNPCPERGSLTFQGAFAVPPNHGGNAGLSVPTVSFPAFTSWRSDLAQLVAEVCSGPVLALLDEPPQPVARPASSTA